MLVVEAPDGYQQERRYILDVVLRDRLGLDWRLEISRRSDVRLSAEGAGDGRCVVMPDVLFSVPPADWLGPASLPRRPLARREGLPVLFGSDAPGGPLMRAEGDTIALKVDNFSGAASSCSRGSRSVWWPRRDSYGRFPASASVAHGEGFLRVPIVDRYVDVLWAALAPLWPRLDARRAQYRVMLTHDVDDPLHRSGGPGPARTPARRRHDRAPRRGTHAPPGALVAGGPAR